jgi:hypothetical protein
MRKLEPCRRKNGPTKPAGTRKVHDRLNQNDVTNKINVEDPDRVRDAVLALLAARYPGADLAPLRRAFDEVKSLFLGTFPGYLSCDTPYHDLRHTLDMTLAMARLLDGHDRSHAAAERIGARRAMLGMVVALLHDSGYMKRASEAHIENGAVFTKIHVSRSADFLSRYLPQLGFAEEAPAAAKLVHFTGYEMDIDDIMLHDPKDRLLGCLVGTADLIGQMSDRMYLEKCREFLYPEFVWGHIAREKLADGREIVRYASPDDLMLKTPGFYEYVARARIEKKLGGADRYAEAHFDGPSLYQSEIDRNMRFLKDAIEEADLKRMRRFCYSLSRKDAKVA